jgi:tRNA U34 5-carboxymethylaminomethyl modifying enzyme MnmG/GidA
MGPLAGLKVIELAGIGPAPFCGMLLADMGAEVIKVEPPGGEMGRAIDRTAIQIRKLNASKGPAVQALRADSNVILTAMGDAFEDRLRQSLETLQNVDAIKERVQVSPENRFVGFDAYQKVDIMCLTV